MMTQETALAMVALAALSVTWACFLACWGLAHGGMMAQGTHHWSWWSLPTRHCHTRRWPSDVRSRPLLCAPDHGALQTPLYTHTQIELGGNTCLDTHVLALPCPLHCPAQWLIARSCHGASPPKLCSSTARTWQAFQGEAWSSSSCSVGFPIICARANTSSGCDPSSPAICGWRR